MGKIIEPDGSWLIDLMLNFPATAATLNNNLAGFTPVVDSTGRIIGYRTKAGADTVFPFSSVSDFTGSLRLSTNENIGSYKTYAYIPISGYRVLTLSIQNNTPGNVSVRPALYKADGTYRNISAGTILLNKETQLYLDAAHISGNGGIVTYNYTLQI